MIAKADSFTTQELKKFKSKVKMCIFTRMPNFSLLLSRSLTKAMLKIVCFSRLSSFFLAAQVFDVLDAEGILTYDFPPSELQEEVDDTVDTFLSLGYMYMMYIVGRYSFL